MREAGPGAALDELLLQVEERLLHLALRLGSPYLAGARLHAIVAHQLEELRVPAEVGKNRPTTLWPSTNWLKRLFACIGVGFRQLAARASPYHFIQLALIQ